MYSNYRAWPISHLTFTTEAQVQFQVSPCRFCDRLNGNVTDSEYFNFPLLLSFHQCSKIICSSTTNGIYSHSCCWCYEIIHLKNEYLGKKEKLGQEWGSYSSTYKYCSWNCKWINMDGVFSAIWTQLKLWMFTEEKLDLVLGVNIPPQKFATPCTRTLGLRNCWRKLLLN
jgi:hypothetical protein